MTKPRPEWIISEGLIDYSVAINTMEQKVNHIINGTHSELVWLLQHEAVYTAGTSASPKDLLDSNRFPIVNTGRGGKYTYHGPGQLIAYLLLNLTLRNQQDLKAYVYNLEQLIIETLAVFNINSTRKQGLIGIWVETEQGPAKIAAIGIRVRKWVTYHGIAINVHPDLSHFDSIIPCGIKEFGVTSMAKLGHKCSVQEVGKVLKDKFDLIF